MQTHKQPLAEVFGYLISDQSATATRYRKHRLCPFNNKVPNYPRPDYLSSSRKRLAPQLIFKGGILNNWKKKIVVALNKSFFDTLPPLKRVDKENADIAWLIFDVMLDSGRYRLERIDTAYTEFQPALQTITQPAPGKLDDFLKVLQDKLDEQLETPPKNEIIQKPF